MLFNFTLKPLEHVQPWGQPGELRLHWFGLTDGQYWIEVGNEALLEYSEHARHLGVERYCDYQVVRLYEDLMAITPDVLEAVPDSLIPYIAGATGRAWQASSRAWFAKSCKQTDIDRFWEIADASATWISDRTLDTGYLAPSARIHFWSDSSFVYIEWDNREELLDGDVPAWSAIQGSYRLPRAKFITEIRTFHARLMEQMGARVESVLCGALPPEIQIDLPGLKNEHTLRCQSIDRLLIGPAAPANWQHVHEAVLEWSDVIGARPHNP